jgi:hypothetical protein
MRRPGLVRWPVLATANAAVLLVVLALALPGEGVSPFVIRMTEVLVAGGAAYLLDDAAAPLTGVTPRGVWRRRLPAGLMGVGVLSTAWLIILLVLRWQESMPPVLATTGEVVVLSVAALAVAAVLARRGDPEPGGQVAPLFGLFCLAALLADSLFEVTLFVPWDTGEPSVGVTTAWMTAGVVAVAVVVGASRDPASHGRSWALG